MVDIRRAYTMFLDVKRSSDYLKDHQKEYLFSEETVVKGTKMDLEWRMIIYLDLNELTIFT